MKILHIHPTLAGGGIEAMVCGLANEMAERGEDVTVCSLFEPKETDVFWAKLSHKVKKVSLGKTKPGFSPGMLFKIAALLRRERYDVVNLHGCFYYYMLAVVWLHRRIRFFYTIHSDAAKENGSWDRRFFPLKRFCFKHKWMRPITISPVSQDSFYGLYRCESDLIYNGVSCPKESVETMDGPVRGGEVEGWRVTPATKVFIHAGRIDTPKNQEVLCRVFRRLIDEGLDVVLLIAGSRQREDIFERIEPFFSSRIVYLGERRDVPSLMAQCDGMCMPSIWEGLPVTLLEALSVGCVPVCSPVGGIVNVVRDGENGILSTDSSEEGYYASMKRFLSMDSQELLSMRHACHSSFETFDIRHTATEYLKAYYMQ